MVGKQKEKSNAILFMALCKSFRIPSPQQEFKFMDKRKFRFDFAWIDEKLAVEIEGGVWIQGRRFDFAWIDEKLAVEIEGGVWIQGRHTRGSGYVKDMEKYNLAAEAGWRVLRFTPQQIKKEETYKIIQNCLGA